MSHMYHASPNTSIEVPASPEEDPEPQNDAITIEDEHNSDFSDNPSDDSIGNMSFDPKQDLPPPQSLESRREEAKTIRVRKKEKQKLYTSRYREKLIQKAFAGDPISLAKLNWSEKRLETERILRIFKSTPHAVERRSMADRREDRPSSTTSARSDGRLSVVATSSSAASSAKTGNTSIMDDGEGEQDGDEFEELQQQLKIAKLEEKLRRLKKKKNSIPRQE